MLLVRSETQQDHAAVYELVRAAFDRPIEADLVNRVRSVEGFISLVAEQDGKIVGHIMFSPVALVSEDGESSPVKLAGLAPVAVRPDHQKQGIGRALIHAGLEECHSAGFVGCFLLGHPEYYPRFGFQPALSTFGIKSTYDVPDPVFMGLEIVEGALAGLTGTIHYHPTFQGI